MTGVNFGTPEIDFHHVKSTPPQTLLNDESAPGASKTQLCDQQPHMILECQIQPPSLTHSGG